MTLPIDPLVVETKWFDDVRVIWTTYWQYLLTLPFLGALVGALARLAAGFVNPPPASGSGFHHA